MKLPARIEKPASERHYWAKRLHQWLLGESENTRRNYSACLTDFSTWAGAPSVDVAMAMLFQGEPEMVAVRVQAAALDYLEDLRTRPVWASPQARERGDDPVRKGLAGNTIKIRMAAFRAVVRLAVEARLCPRDVTLPKTKKSKATMDTQGISRREYLELLEVFDHTIDTTKVGSMKHDLAIRDKAIILLLHVVGLRRAEVRGLQIEHIVRNSKGMSIWIQRKGDSEDELQLWPIASEPAQAIDTWLAVRGNPTHGQIFTNRKGRPLQLRIFNDIVSRWGVRSDVGHVRPHQLRHTAVDTLRKKTNGNITGMQGFAGHADPKTTMIYVHNEGEEIRALQELLSGSNEEE